MLPHILGQVPIFKKPSNNGIRKVERREIRHLLQQILSKENMISTQSGGGEKYESTPLDELADSGMVPEDEEAEETEETEETEEDEEETEEDESEDT